MAPVGETKDAGWNIGVSKTLPYSVPELWDFITSTEGITLWLGEGAVLENGSAYKTADGTTGEVRSIREHDRIRLTWGCALSSGSWSALRLRMRCGW